MFTTGLSSCYFLSGHFPVSCLTSLLLLLPLKSLFLLLPLRSLFLVLMSFFYYFLSCPPSCYLSHVPRPVTSSQVPVTSCQVPPVVSCPFPLSRSTMLSSHTSLLLLQGLRYADAPAEGFPRYRYSGDARCLQERRS